jgi:hypothetical protein
MPTIEVFLMFDPKKERNYYEEVNSKTHKRVRTPDPAPDWKWLKGVAKNNGYTLIVYGPPYTPSAKEIQDSMNNAEVTLLVGTWSESGAPPPRLQMGH